MDVGINYSRLEARRNRLPHVEHIELREGESASGRALTKCDSESETVDVW